MQPGARRSAVRWRDHVGGEREPSRVIVVTGPPCAGKSLMARRLSASLGAPHFEMDYFRRRAIPRSDQRVEHRDIAYRAMHAAVELMAPRCGTVILDATYTARRCRLDLIGVVKRLGAPLFVVECRVAPATAVRRFLERGEHPAVDLTRARVAALAKDYPYFDGALSLTRGGHDALDLAVLLRYVHGAPMSRSQVREWCEVGRPRERTDRRRGPKRWSAAQLPVRRALSVRA